MTDDKHITRRKIELKPSKQDLPIVFVIIIISLSDHDPGRRSVDYVRRDTAVKLEQIGARSCIDVWEIMIATDERERLPGLGIREFHQSVVVCGVDVCPRVIRHTQHAASW